MTDFAKLKALAEAANAVTGDVNVEMVLVDESGSNQAEIDAVTAFLAATKPAVVLGLIADLDGYKQGAKVEADAADEARAEVRRLKAELEHTGHHHDQLRNEYGQLKAECEGLRKAMRDISTQVDGNIRVTVRDCVNGRDDVQDIYDYCDQIDLIIDAAVSKEPGQ